MSSAKALSALLAKTYPLDIRIVDFYERVVPHLDPFRRLMGKSVDDFYNQHCLNKPYGGVLASVLLNGVSSIGVMLQNKIERALIREFEAYSPDLVVSVTPHINRFVVRAANCLNIPTSIMVTDLFELYRGFWIPPNARNALVPEAALKRIPKGRRAHCAPLTLPLVRAPFYDSFEGTAGDDRPNCLVIFGGHGSNAMIRIAEALKPFGGRITADFVCGHSKGLKSLLDERELPEGFRVHGYVEDIHRLYRQADFVLGKTGPGVIVESILSGSYPILLGGWWGLPQERPNVGWLNGMGLGRVVGSLPAMIEELRSKLHEKPVTEPRLRDMALRDPEMITEFYGRILDRSGPPRQQSGFETVAP